MSSPQFIMLCGVLLAADPTSTLESAVPGVGVNQASVAPEQLVRAALRQEIEGNPSERQALLQTALELDSNYAPARWHLGQVEYTGQWFSPSEISAKIAQDPRYLKYREARPRYADHAKDHFEFARWCQAHDLPLEQRAHLLTAAHLDPNNPQWQRALGRSLHEGLWMTDEQFADAKRRYEQAIAAYHEWKPKLHRLRRAIEKTRARGESYGANAALYDIKDPTAIPALEEVFSLTNEDLALRAIDVLRRMIHQDATRSLVRHAVWSQWASVRQEAISELQTRDPDFFMPLLIDYLRPARSGEAWVRLGDGRPAGIWLIQDFNTNYVDVAISSAIAINRGRISPEQRKEEVRFQFSRVDEGNQNRMQNTLTALHAITGEKLEADQTAWRKWWAGVNHVFYQFSQSDEPHRQTTRRTRRVALFGLPGTSCFVSGTPVWTRHGVIPIDQIQQGDLVLSADPDTGELAYRAVVERTIRPRTEISNLQVNGESLGATLGHPIWVSGKGWVKVKDLETADPLRGCGEIHALDSMTEGKPAMAYNLVVAEFHTYFVGESKVLVHDNTPITDSLLKVPGLKPTSGELPAE